MPSPIQMMLSAEKDARDFGFVYPNVEMILEQIKDECNEVKEAIDNKEPQNRQQEEIGDLIHAAIALCYHQDFDVEETIAKSANKFALRMKRFKAIAQEKGLPNVLDMPVAKQLEIWKQAKE